MIRTKHKTLTGLTINNVYARETVVEFTLYQQRLDFSASVIIVIWSNRYVSHSSCLGFDSPSCLGAAIKLVSSARWQCYRKSNTVGDDNHSRRWARVCSSNELISHYCKAWLLVFRSACFRLPTTSWWENLGKPGTDASIHFLFAPRQRHKPAPAKSVTRTTTSVRTSSSCAPGLSQTIAAR